MGGWRPEILLPDHARDWSAVERDAAVRHEAAHVRHRDWAWQIGARIVVAALWLHPLVWVAERALRREAERAADDAVLASGVEAADYARQLVRIARLATRRPPAVVAMAQPAGLEARVRRLLDQGLRRGPVGRRAIASVTTAFMALAVVVAHRGPVYEVDDVGIVPPSVVKEVRPTYPPETLRDKIEGKVALSLRVDRDERPTDITVVQPLAVSLDRASIEAASEWRFAPGRRNGRAVDVRVDLEFEFQVR